MSVFALGGGKGVATPPYRQTGLGVSGRCAVGCGWCCGPLHGFGLFPWGVGGGGRPGGGTGCREWFGEFFRQEHDHRGASEGGASKGHRQAVTAGDASDDRQSQSGSGDRVEVLPLGDGRAGPGERFFTHDQAAVLDHEHDACLDLLHVYVDLGRGRGELRGVVEEFGQGVDDAFGGKPCHRPFGDVVQAHAPVVTDPGHGAPDDAFQGDGSCPSASGACSGEYGDAVGCASGLGGAVVQVHEVTQDVARGTGVAVAFLHLPQVGEHLGGQGLKSSGRGGAGGDGGGSASFGVGDRRGEGVQDGPSGRVLELGQRVQYSLGRFAGSEFLHHRGQALLCEVARLAAQSVDLRLKCVVLAYAVVQHQDQHHEEHQSASSGDQKWKEEFLGCFPQRPDPQGQGHQRKEEQVRNGTARGEGLTGVGAVLSHRAPRSATSSLLSVCGTVGLRHTERRKAWQDKMAPTSTFTTQRVKIPPNTQSGTPVL